MDRKGYSSRGRSSSHYSSSSRTPPSYGSSHSRYETSSSRDYRDSGYSSRGSHHTSSSVSSDRYDRSSSSSSRYPSDDRYRSSSSSAYVSSSSRPDDRYRDSYRSSSSHYSEPVYDSRSYDRHPTERSSSSYKRPYPPPDEPRSSSYSARPEQRYRYEDRAPRLSPARAAYEPPPPPRSSFRAARRPSRGLGLRGRGGSRILRPRSGGIARVSDLRPRRGMLRGSVVRRAHIARRQREEALAEAEKAVQEITGDDDTESAAKRRKSSESEASTVQVKEEPKEDADKSSETKAEGTSSKSTPKVVKVTGTRGGTLPYIKLVCPHCSYRCLTFKDYTHHLSGSRHVSALHNVSMRMKLYLQKLRERQRRDQADIDKQEENQAEAESNFCLPCKLYYKNSKNSHEDSKIHKVIVEYLNPRCKNCAISFHNRLMYEKHLASINHIRKLASAEIPTDVKKDKKDEGEEEMSMDKFMTVDAVGNVDDEGADSTGKKVAPPKTVISKTPGAVGELYVERVDVYYCRLCERYLARTSPLEKAIGLHCRGPTHKRNYRAKHGAGEKEESSSGAASDEPKTEEGEQQKKAEEDKEKVVQVSSTERAANGAVEGKGDEQVWDDVYKDLNDLGDIVEGDDQKSQGDEETPQERFNRLKNSSEKVTAEKCVNGEPEEK